MNESLCDKYVVAMIADSKAYGKYKLGKYIYIYLFLKNIISIYENKNISNLLNALYYI